MWMIINSGTLTETIQIFCRVVGLTEIMRQRVLCVFVNSIGTQHAPKHTRCSETKQVQRLFC